MHDSRSGFTLIELLVVILIIGLLVVALFPNITGSLDSARKTADEANLRWHHQNLLRYKGAYKSFPTKGGHKFVLAPWVRKVVEHTPQNRDRYFSPDQQPSEYIAELKALPAEEIWKDFDSLNSEDTDYAGRAGRYMRGDLYSGKEPLMANDNEFIRAYEDGTIIVLMGDGTTRRLLWDVELAEYGYPADADDSFIYPVGPESEHPMLQKLEY